MTAQQIKKIRKSLGLTQVQMAKVLGISQREITRYEKGDNGISRVAARLLNLLHVKPELVETCKQLAEAD